MLLVPSESALEGQHSGPTRPVGTPSHSPTKIGSWSMDSITNLPECGSGFNAIYTCVDRLTKLVRLTPRKLGAGELSAATVASMFFN